MQLFHEKFNLPAPKLVDPLERQKLRLMFRNERHLHKRKCSLTGRDIISMYPVDAPFPVYHRDAWWSDNWNPLIYGRDFDFTKTFTENFRELQKYVPKMNLIIVNVVNSEYTNYVVDVKNCYLVNGTIFAEDCYYGSPYYCKDCVDSTLLRHSELCYECVDSEKLYNCDFCTDCQNSRDLSYCYDVKTSHDCVFCVGLRNAEYHIFNKKYSKEEYEKKLIELNLKNPSQKLFEQWEDIKCKVPRQFMVGTHNENATGNYLFHCKNTVESFNCEECEDCAYAAQVMHAKDCQDLNYMEFAELCYNSIGYWRNYQVWFSNTCGDCKFVQYSEFCANSKYLFGCISLKNQEYCIFNKKYSKEEYEKLEAKIINHMKETGEYGNFFDKSLSPFTYEESCANDYFPR
ncbi:hypothetical protein HZA39_04685 [Candidatus Peregrinibacteria bacterium]|nr:hypothetical protein [Candidatus Peregrinibacteria bacterium]